MVERCKISLGPLSGRERVAGYAPRALTELFGTRKVAPQLNFDRAGFAQKSARATRGMSISGVQEKLSVALNDGRLEPTIRNGQFILKPSPAGYPFAAENEHAGMLVSKALGIETAACGLVSFVGGELAYITRRFDRTDAGERLAQEDLASVAGLGADEKYDPSYETLGLEVLEACGGKKVAVADFLARVMTAYAMGNDDLHAKNFSLRRLSDNKTPYYDGLTPNYDVLFASSIIPDGSTHFLALDLLDGDESEQFQHFGFYTGHDFQALGVRLGLPVSVVRRAYTTLARAEATMLSMIQRSYMPEPMRRHASETVRSRLRALKTGM